MSAPVRKMIHCVRGGDTVTLLTPDGVESEQFVLAEPISLEGEEVWIYRENDVPMVVPRPVALESSFNLYGRRNA